MMIERLINETTPPLRPDDSVEHALGLMMELRVEHLPVVTETGHLIGLVSEEQLLRADSPGQRVERLLRAEPVSILPGAHIFDAAKALSKHHLTILPVADSEQCYVGMVRRQEIFERFAEMFRTDAAGAILALEVNPRDYALSQLTYAVEQNGIKILSIASETDATDDDKIRITLKLDARDTARVRHVLEHHGYTVVASFNEEEDDMDLQHRVDEFMRYLEV
jgi:acetoin utilization protein AcuB